MARVYKRLSEAEREERFLERVMPEPNSGCWLWVGVLFPNGYGCFQRHTYAHRWSFERFAGTIPQDLELDHKCRTRSCVNPDHLEPVTHAENTLRGSSVPANNARKTHCKRGHLLCEENRNPSARARGFRNCAQCGRDNAAARRAKLGGAWRVQHRDAERARRAKRKAAANGH